MPAWLGSMSETRSESSSMFWQRASVHGGGGALWAVTRCVHEGMEALFSRKEIISSRERDWYWLLMLTGPNKRL